MPVLCDSCLHNRAIIQQLKKGGPPEFTHYSLLVFQAHAGIIVFQGRVAGEPQQDTIWKMVGEHAQALVSPLAEGDRITFSVELQRAAR